jgi:SAM-dependent methyltransferase
LDDILNYCDTQEEIYKELIKRLPEVSPNFCVDIWRALTSLKAIKHDLGNQAVKLLKLQGVKKIDGVLEIGSPARYVEDYRKGGIEISGTIYANDDKESFISKFPKKAYHHFIPLDFNQKPNYGMIQENTLELVTCYAGLHHFSKENLMTFIKEMKRILKPGGKFLLVDHDITNDLVNHQAHLAHLIFNAVNAVNLQDELSEVRVFKSMPDWIDEMTKNGFQLGQHPDKELIRDNDPTRNRMLCFFKEIENQQNPMQGQSLSM